MSVSKRTWTYNGQTKEAWQVDYRDQDGIRRRKAFQTKKHADAYQLRVRNEIGAGVHTPANASITVADAGKRWLNHCLDLVHEKRLERATVVAYQQHVDLHIVPYLGNVKLSLLTVPMVAQFLDRLRADGRSPAMVRKARVSLGALLSHVHDRGLVAQNVVHARGRTRNQQSDRGKAVLQVGIDIPAPKEIRAIERTVVGRYRPLLITAFFTGLRASELRGLRWQDLDLKRGELHVRQRVDRYGEFGSPKSKAGRRTVPLMPMVVAILREHKLATPANDLDLVFPNSKGKVDHLRTIVEGWQAAQVAAGVVNAAGAAKYPGLHATRHFYASWCINRREDGGLGLTSQMVQKYMGHSTNGMTMDVYAHLFPRTDHAAEMAEAQRHWQIGGAS